MHSFDSLARSMARPHRRAGQAPRPVRQASVLAPIVAIGCAVLPLTIMAQAYLMTA